MGEGKSSPFAGTSPVPLPRTGSRLEHEDLPIPKDALIESPSPVASRKITGAIFRPANPPRESPTTSGSQSQVLGGDETLNDAVIKHTVGDGSKSDGKNESSGSKNGGDNDNSTSTHRRPRSLFEYCRAGDLKHVRRELDRGVNVNVLENMATRNTLLHFAAVRGHLHIVRFLVGRNANINLKNAKGMTPLYAAATKGHSDVVQALIDSGGSVYDTEDQLRETALHVAARHGDIEVADMLVNYGGADVNAKDMYGANAFYHAVHEGKREMVVWLVEHGAVVNETESRVKEMPLHTACRRGFFEIVQILLENGPFEDLFGRELQMGNTALHLACENNFAQIAAYLIKVVKGAIEIPAHRSYYTRVHVRGEESRLREYIHMKNRLGWTPFHCAADIGSSDICRLLLREGFNPNFPKPSGIIVGGGTLGGRRTPKGAGTGTATSTSTTHRHALDSSTTGMDDDSVPFYPIHAAMCAGRGNPQVVDMLIHAYADVNCPTVRGIAPIHMAVEAGNARLLEVLITGGASLDLPEGTNHFTPLHLASRRGSATLCAQLLKAGADQNNSNEDGVTPLHVAAAYARLDVVRVFLEHAHSYNRVGTAIDIKDACGRTALCYAIDSSLDARKDTGGSDDRLLCVQLLVRNGSGIDSTDDAGNTPLHYGVRYGYLDAVKVLVEAGADVDAFNEDGQTPLDMASALYHEASSEQVYLQNLSGQVDPSGQSPAPIQTLPSSTADELQERETIPIPTQSPALAARNISPPRQSRMKPDLQVEVHADLEVLRLEKEKRQWSRIWEYLYTLAEERKEKEKKTSLRRSKLEGLTEMKSPNTPTGMIKKAFHARQVRSAQTSGRSTTENVPNSAHNNGLSLPSAKVVDFASDIEMMGSSPAGSVRSVLDVSDDMDVRSHSSTSSFVDGSPTDGSTKKRLSRKSTNRDVYDLDMEVQRLRLRRQSQTLSANSASSSAQFVQKLPSKSRMLLGLHNSSTSSLPRTGRLNSGAHLYGPPGRSGSIASLSGSPPIRGSSSVATPASVLSRTFASTHSPMSMSTVNSPIESSGHMTVSALRKRMFEGLQKVSDEAAEAKQ